MHYQFGSRTFTESERLDITAQNIEAFKRMYPDFYPCASNAEKLMDFLTSQIGSNEGADATYFYPFTLENFMQAYRAILASGQFFIERPESDEDIAEREQATRDEEEQIRRDDENEAASRRNQIYALRKIDTAALRVWTARKRPSGGGEKHQTTALPGDESRRLGVSDVSARAAARMRTAIKYPLVKRDSIQFNELVNDELSK